MLLEVVMISVLLGVVLTLIVQLFLMRWYLNRIPQQNPQDREQFPVINLPQVLKEKLKDGGTLQQKENCLWLNLMGQFLFQELRDTSTVRRWVMRKMNFEFAELLQTTSGKLLAHIIVRDFSLGTKFPVVGGVSVQKVELGEGEQLECLDITMDVDYDGGFTLGVDVMLPFNKMAFISVTLRKLCGRARLQLTRLPYTHWSFSFLQEPEASFDVESHFEGRPLPQVAALIVNQLRRTIRKKHTLPNYKMRFKPVFPRPEMVVSPCRLKINGQCITVGRLCVTFIKCSRLPALSRDTTLYCILSADVKPWKELVRGQRKVWVTYDVEVIKGQAENIGMNFKDEYLMDRYGMAVIVDLVQVDSPAAKADIRKGDVLISVATTRIVSVKQAAKLFKNAGEKFSVRIERPQAKLPQDVKFQEDAVSLYKPAETEVVEDCQPEDGDEFINISIQTSTTVTATTASDSVSVSSEPGPRDRGPKLTAPVSGDMQLLRPKSSSDLTSMASSGLRTRKSSADSTPPPSSPRLRRRTISQGPQSGRADMGINSNPNSLAPGPRANQGPTRKDHSPARDSLKSASLAPDSKEDEARSVCSADSDSDDDASPVMKTREVPASQNPRWHDPLSFDLGDQHAYLNVCVWCHNTEHMDVKPDRPTPPPHRDLLLGQVSVPVNMVVLQCLMTMQGDSQQTLELQPGQIKAGASRKSWAGHIGFEPHRCYGDVTLRFQFTPSNLDKQQRQMFVRDLDPSDPADLAGVGIEMEANDSSQEELSDSETVSGEGRHLFSRAQFNSATYCNFCGKKIWMKNAFQCNTCDMISHKKCIEKCRAETLCSADGPRRRSAPGEFWRTPTAARKQMEEETGTQSPRQQTRSSRILSRLKGVNKAETSKPETSPQPSRRSESKEKSKTRETSEPAMPTDLQFLHGTLDDAAINAAKQKGRQLFSQLEVSDRKARLDQMVNKMQIDIDQETSNKILLTQQLQEADSHSSRAAVKLAITKSNEKIEALMLLLLQYCAGLQHCLDQEEEQRQQMSTASAPTPQAKTSTSVGLAETQSLSVSAVNGMDKEDAATAMDEQQTEEAVAQAITELIDADDDNDSSSSDEVNDNDDEELTVEHFRPIFQSTENEKDTATEVEKDIATEVPKKSVIPKAKVVLEGSSEFCTDSDEGRELEESTSL
ncbi:PDZ domain-containing protein 8-like [Babylonia areolata]|uniref:PDZ domain-containing protein 8-like n=1 Tax=Babylonia areolata TaxID=304850 RepID=UPI003FD37AD9